MRTRVIGGKILESTLGAGNWHVQIIKTGRILSMSSRECDAKLISKSLDDTELKLLRQFYWAFRHKDRAVVDCDFAAANKLSKILEVAYYKIRLWRAKEANKKETP